MKIAFDASCLAVNRLSGLGEFAHHLLSHMPGLANDIDISLYINYFRKSSHPKSIKYSSTVNHFLKAPRRLIEFLWRFNWLPFDSYLKNIDIFHSIHIHVPPSKKMKTVLTVHDCRYLAFPGIYQSREVKNYRQQMKRSLERVDFVVAISEFTRQEILQYFSFPENRVMVIHYGFNPLKPINTSHNNDSRNKNFDISQPYLLAPSALDPRKNLGKLIEAFAQCKKENESFPTLVVAGIPNEQWEISNEAEKAKELNVYSDIIMCGIVDRNRMTELIQSAQALCYLSLYEGFGLPPLEGMSLGIPVLASKKASIPEISGDAACLVDALDEDDISSGLNKIIYDSEYRHKLIEKGYIQIKKFSWDKTATRYLKLYRELLSQ
jgi:glycosyltransferase involved in cell wall biosynthesis